MDKIPSILLMVLCILLYTSYPQSYAAPDPWVEELKSAIGLSVGNLDPRYPELEKQAPGVEGPDTGEGQKDLPIDPDTVNPNQQDAAAKIREWISIAEPPQNVTEGASFRYDEWGGKVGRTADGVIAEPAGRPDYALATPEATTWSLRKKLDSVNHCTLEEYVIKKLNNQSIADCAGRYRAPQTVPVPDLTDQPYASAKEALERAGVKIKVSGKPAPSKEKEHTVAAQRPVPGTQIKKGQTVELVIYGPAKKTKLTVPNLEGLSLKKAKAKLREKGLKSKPKAGKAATSKREEYTVASQYPTPGTLIKKGQTVELVIYGPYRSMVTVPDVTRLTADEAMDRLAGSGLKARIRTIGRARSKHWSERVKEVKPNQWQEPEWRRIRKSWFPFTENSPPPKRTWWLSTIVEDIREHEPIGTVMRANPGAAVSTDRSGVESKIAAFEDFLQMKSAAGITPEPALKAERLMEKSIVSAQKGMGGRKINVNVSSNPPEAADGTSPPAKRKFKIHVQAPWHI